ncbi:type II secretion system protein GspM [Pseudomonas sp. App30]|uniref:type II secretion system protein GspM n=1 Tax=Pseudomonas sp. App30 TaxID=3068990 RepID=UPI003A8076A8
MRRQPTRNERRILALAVLALLLWAAWQLLVASWFSTPMAELAEQAATLQAQHQRYAQVLAQGPALQAALAQARQNPSARRSLLPGNDPSAAAADLMQAAVDRVKAVAALGPGCEVTQRMPIVPEADGGQAYRQVKVSLTLACASEPLMQLLHGLEYGQPYLFVEALSVHRNNDAPAAGGPGRLSVQLLLRGYLTGAAAAKEPRP